MTISILALIAALWVACAVGSAGFAVAYFHRRGRLNEDGWRQELGTSLLFGLLLGPIALLAAFFFSGFAEHGWKLWPPKG